MKSVANFLLFQAGWFACVLGAANGHAWLGPSVVALILALHFIWFGSRGEAVTIAAGAGLGSLADAALGWSALVEYRAHGGLEGWSPPWITAMWANFGITLRHSLHWLEGRWALAFFLGAAGGPLAYLAGERLGAVVLSGRGGALLALAAIWALALPFLSWLTMKLS